MGILWFALGCACGYALNQYREKVKAWVLDALSRFGDGSDR